MKRFLWSVSIVAAAVLVGFVFGKQISRSPSGQPTLRTPLTAFETVENLDSSGKQTGIRNLIFGLATDGSYFLYTVSENGTAKDHVTVFDAGARAKFVLDHPTKSITSYPLSDRTVKFEVARQLGNCDAATGEHTKLVDDSVRVTGEHATKLGYDTVRVAGVRKTGLGPDSVESFEAPVLNCFPLQETQTFREGDSIRMTATKIIQGEPDPSYFQRPPDSVERKPSDVLAEQVRLKLRSNCPKCEADAYANFDKIYASKHSPK